MSDNFIVTGSSPYYFVDRFSAEYPDKLQQITDPPTGIYVKGRLPNPDIPSVAIVGSRICSQYGRLCAEKFGRELAENGIQVISGLARGIDGISQHHCAINGGHTFGVLGCGINVVYPSQNRFIYEEILSNDGGLISETAPDAPPIGRQFASRNRIISALADLVLVIEAKERSGTQITVRKALEQGKDIFAIPGRINDICSAGCNQLISEGAGIATDTNTILDALGIKSKSCESSTKDSLDKIERKIYDALDMYPIGLEQLSIRVKIPIPELLNILFHLQLKGYIKESTPGYYVHNIIERTN